MRNLRSPLKFILIISIAAWFTACGGNGSGSDDEVEASTSCIIGASTIGECKI